MWKLGDNANNFPRLGGNFMYVFCLKMNISLLILALFEFKRFLKTLSDFSNNTFSIETQIINLFQYKSRIQ